MPPQHSASSDRFELRIPSDHVHIEEVVETAEAFLAGHIKDDDVLYQIVLSMSEAVTNAIRHGNELDASKQVDIKIVVEEAGVLVAVEDEGAGFDRAAVHDDPLAEDNLLREGGRGIFLIESMADEVAFENGGRRIRMVFNRDAAS